jgi:site-specific DNA-cytosine methylase
MFENVGEIVKSNEGNDLSIILKTMLSMRYTCKWTKLAAKDVGSPQIRLRWYCLCVLQRYTPERLQTMPTSQWSAHIPRPVAKKPLDFASRYSGLGNAVVPQAVFAAFNILIGDTSVQAKKSLKEWYICIESVNFKGNVPKAQQIQNKVLRALPTPRAQMWRRAYTLTTRCSADLPTLALYIHFVYQWYSVSEI